MEPLAEGIYAAVCTQLIDTGLQYNEKFDKTQQKITFGWEIIGESISVDGEVQPRIKYKEYTNSLHEKGTLRPMLQSWRGKAFTEEELERFDLMKVLGKPCQLQIIHETRNNRVYTNIASIIAMPKGMAAEATETPFFFDMDEPDKEVFNRLPQFIKDKIAKARNFADTGLGTAHAGDPEAEDGQIGTDEELPF